jgi:serine protease
MTLIGLKRAGLLSLLSLAVAGLAITIPLGAQGAAQGPAQPDPDRYIVKFSDAGPGRAAVAAAGGIVLLDLPEVSAAAARLPAQALQALANHPAVEYIEPDAPRYPLAQTTPYGIPMVQADQVSDAQAFNRTVCIIDSGYALGHQDLPPATGTNNSGSGSWFIDNCAHGTHVAGTIAALNNGVGVVGALPNGNVNLHIIKVFGNDTTSSCSWTYSSNLIAAANACQSAGANVISMSLGGSFSSTTERNAFQGYYDNGILSVAAAGNSGNTQFSYPASYASVISVAAVDSAKVAASFSQRNSQVELAAPGVAVRSTVPMGTGTEESLAVGGATYEVVGMDGTPNASGAGPLVDCGLGTAACPGGGGQVCLIQRGSIAFAEKVLNCQAGGGVGAVIYNNAEALFSGTLGGTATTIPSVGTSGATGSVLLGLLGQTASVTTGPGNYAFFDGTSMATPHVSGVAALVWSHDTDVDEPADPRCAGGHRAGPRRRRPRQHVRLGPGAGEGGVGPSERKRSWRSRGPGRSGRSGRPAASDRRHRPYGERLQAEGLQHRGPGLDRRRLHDRGHLSGRRGSRLHPQQRVVHRQHRDQGQGHAHLPGVRGRDVHLLECGDRGVLIPGLWLPALPGSHTVTPGVDKVTMQIKFR